MDSVFEPSVFEPLLYQTSSVFRWLQYLPWQNNFLVVVEVCMIIEGRKLSMLGRKSERCRAKIKLTLLKRHETGSGEETRCGLAENLK